MRRVRIFDADVKKYGFTSSCPRCQALKESRHVQARGLRHNEECREFIYDSLRADGAEKVKHADLVDSSRTKTRARRPAEEKADDRPVQDQPTLEEVPDIPIVETEENFPMSKDADDTFDFYKEVDADAELGVEWDGGMLDDVDGNHPMNPIMDVLQSLGVSAADAANHSAKFIKCSSASACDFGRPCNPILPSYDPSFFEA